MMFDNILLTTINPFAVLFLAVAIGAAIINVEQDDNNTCKSHCKCVCYEQETEVGK